MILKASAVAAAAMFALSGAPALAQLVSAPSDKAPSPEGKALGECMIAHSTPEVENLFKQVLIDALTDDTDKLNKETAVLGISMLSLAIQSCGVTATELQSPKLGEGAKAYGEAVGIKIMTAAFAKMGH